MSSPENKDSNDSNSGGGNEVVEKETIAPRWITEEQQDNGQQQLAGMATPVARETAPQPVTETTPPPPSSPTQLPSQVPSQIPSQPQEQHEQQQQQQLPLATPPRTYPRQQQLGPVSFVGAPRPRDYRTLERFFNGLVTFLVWSGTLSGAAYLLFKTVIFPRLSLRYLRLGMIYRFHEEKFTRIYDMLKKVVMNGDGGTSTLPLLSKSYLIVKGGDDKKNKESVEVEEQGEAEAENINEREGEETNNEEIEESKEEEKGGYIKESMDEVTELLKQVKENIKNLPAAKEYGDKSEKTIYADDTEKGEAVRMLWSMQQTSNVISMLNYDAVTSISERGAGIPSAFGLSSSSITTTSSSSRSSSPVIDVGTTKAFERAANDLRTEIRGMKGYLLSRRNFVAPGRST